MNVNGEFRIKDLHLTDIHRCRVVWQYLINRVTSLNAPRPYIERPKTKSEFKDSIIDIVVQRISKQEHNLLTKELIQICNANSISDNDLEWINADNGRACYFVYQKIKSAVITMPPLNFIRHPDTKTEYISWDNELGKSLWPAIQPQDTLQNKSEYIQELLGSLVLSREIKVTFLEQLKETYFALKKSKMSFDFSWAQNDKDMHVWLYEYIRNNLLNKKVFYLHDQYIDNYFLSSAEIFDMWDASAEQKELFLLKLKKAYRQKAYRNSKVGKQKVYTYTMSTEIQKIMDSVAKSKGISKSRIIENLIREEHKRLEQLPEEKRSDSIF